MQLEETLQKSDEELEVLKGDTKNLEVYTFLLLHVCTCTFVVQQVFYCNVTIHFLQCNLMSTICHLKVNVLWNGVAPTVDRIRRIYPEVRPFKHFVRSSKHFVARPGKFSKKMICKSSEEIWYFL